MTKLKFTVTYEVIYEVNDDYDEDDSLIEELGNLAESLINRNAVEDLEADAKRFDLYSTIKFKDLGHEFWGEISDDE